MKKLLLIIAWVICTSSFAQVVNIPDANFKNYLLNYPGLPIDTNGDNEIQVSEAQAKTSLQIIPSSAQPITSLVGIEAFTSLHSLSIIVSFVPALDLTALTQLVALDISGGVGSLNISTLSNLSDLYISDAGMQTLDLSNLTALTSLSIDESEALTSLIMGYKPNLTNLMLYTHSLTSLDLSGCTNLSSINVTFMNPNHDIYLNLKNGDVTYTSASVLCYSSNYSYKIYICIDEGEESNLSVTGIKRLSTYCNITPGGNHNTITGAVTFDAAGNGCNTGSISIPHSRVMITSGSQSGYSVTSDNNYSLFTGAGTFIIAPQLENNTWFTASPPSAQVTFANAANNAASQNFCMSAVGVHPDIEVIARPVTGAQPGFDAYYEIIYRNKGNQALSGVITITFDDNVMDFVSASVTPASTAIGSLTWNYLTIQPFEIRSIVINMNMNAPTDTPPLNLADNLAFTVAATPVAGDENPADNTFTLGQVVTGAFDPNDITCLEGDTEHPDNIGKYLHYNINFENTGTAPATFIVVKDIIDTAKFDMASLQLINASHNVQTRINGNKVEFYFEAINLSPNQKGNVLFKIKTLPTLSVNSSVTQNANIYFDYNWPITTNDATTTFQLLSSGGFAQDASVKIYPNPSSSVVNITATTSISSLQLYDMQGRLLEAVSPKLNEARIDISQRTNGIYFLKITTENGVKVEKLVKQ